MKGRFAAIVALAATVFLLDGSLATATPMRWPSGNAVTFADSGGTSYTDNPEESGGDTCGGAERWPVKVGTDPAATSIDADSAVPQTIANLNALEPSDAIAANDNMTRMKVEETVYRVNGYLGFFKIESGRGGDQDYHLVITDETGRYTRGGRGTEPTGHSLVAEIPNPHCFMGSHGDDPPSGPLQQRIAKARACFEMNTAQIDGRAIEPLSIPVTVTGIAFFDFDHGQIGRGLAHEETNGRHVAIEIHPVLSIKFDNGVSCETIR